MAKTQSADLVVVGAGMVGGWASWFAATSGAERVVVLEKDLAGQGASSRARRAWCARRAARRRRSRSAGARSTSTARSKRASGPTPGSASSAT